MNPQTIWRTVVDRMPPPPKPPANKRTYTPEQVARRNELRRMRYAQRYVSKKAPPVVVDALYVLPRKVVEVVDYAALAERLKQGPLIAEVPDIENVRHMLRHHATKLSIRTIRALVDGELKTVTEMRSME